MDSRVLHLHSSTNFRPSDFNVKGFNSSNFNQLKTLKCNFGGESIVFYSSENIFPCIQSNFPNSHFNSMKSIKKIKSKSTIVSSSSKRNENASVSEDKDLVKKLTEVLWGKKLPPSTMVKVATFAWNTVWKIMMGQLAPRDSKGNYVRSQSVFRDQISQNGKFPPEKNRYVLYAALSCPWAHRTLIVYNLKKLKNFVSICVALPGDSGLWKFLPPENLNLEREKIKELEFEAEIVFEKFRPTADLANGKTFVRELYELADSNYNGRATLPLIWDKKTNQIVNNESSEIIEILNSSFDECFENSNSNSNLNLSPSELSDEIKKWNEEIYENVNNGVYKCGFATTQHAYDVAVTNLFQTLDKIENRLNDSCYLCGDTLTLADVRLFTTLYRFDSVYFGLFKCNLQKICEYKNISNYLKNIYTVPGVSETCDMKSIVENYYGSLFPLNPGALVPSIPRSCSYLNE